MTHRRLVRPVFRDDRSEIIAPQNRTQNRMTESQALHILQKHHNRVRDDNKNLKQENAKIKVSGRQVWTILFHESWTMTHDGPWRISYRYLAPKALDSFWEIKCISGRTQLEGKRVGIQNKAAGRQTKKKLHLDFYCNCFLKELAPFFHFAKNDKHTEYRASCIRSLAGMNHTVWFRTPEFNLDMI